MGACRRRMSLLHDNPLAVDGEGKVLAPPQQSCFCSLFLVGGGQRDVLPKGSLLWAKEVEGEPGLLWGNS